MNMDEKMMRRCIELAKESVDAGDYPFGAVIISDQGDTISEGRNREVTEHDLTWHAEMEAIRRATKSLKRNSLGGLTLYTNGQPCLMCSAAIRRAGLARVVFGAPSQAPLRTHRHPLTDPDYGESPPPVVEGGLLAEESRALQKDRGK